jgi:hypothetical protein
MERVKIEKLDAEKLKVKKLRMTIFAVGVLAIGGMSAIGQAQAAVPGGADAIRQAAENGAITEPVQFFFGGRNYCWYEDGWQGPGWYWCGYAYRPGFGWGGPIGWNNWRHDRDDFRVREFHDRDRDRFDRDRDRFRDHDDRGRDRDRGDRDRGFR